jgi:hypothetical protein
VDGPRAWPIICMLAALFLSDPVRAADLSFATGNVVHEMCSKQNSTEVRSYVAGLTDQSRFGSGEIDAVLNQATDDYGRAVMAATADIFFGYCIPNNVILDQIKDVFCAYLRNGPQDRHLSGARLFQRAMQQAWPCTRLGQPSR